MGPQDPKEVTGQVTHDLTQLASDLAQTKADATRMSSARVSVPRMATVVVELLWCVISFWLLPSL